MGFQYIFVLFLIVYLSCCKEYLCSCSTNKFHCLVMHCKALLSKYYFFR